MAEFPVDPTGADLRAIFAQAFKGSGKAYNNYIQAQNPDLRLERSPAAEMAASSPIGSAIKQALPNRVGDTRVGQIIADNLPERMRRGFLGIGLGGLSDEELGEFSKARAEDPELRRATVELGKVPLQDGITEVDLGPGNYRAKAAQAAGVVAADMASDGMRNVWWFLNAPQAVAQVAMFQGMRQASANAAQGDPNLDPRQALIRNRNLRMAAAAPAWIATSMGIGNFARQPGYKATAPSELDPTETANPIAEVANRYFLGRSGRLLPYEEFVKERPDVSRGEYNAYKAYLFSGSSPVKATLDGIQGPEVTFMGKSIPLATGLIPMAGAVIGARRGIRRGVAAVNKGDGYADEAALLKVYQDLKESSRNPKAGVSDSDVSKALMDYRKQQEENENTVAKSVIANTSAITGASALSGYVLESIRRALKGKAPQYEDENS